MAYFLAALGVSLAIDAGRAVDGPATRPLEPSGRRVAVARPLADGAYERDRLWLFGQRVSGRFALGDSPADVAAGARPPAVVVHLRRLAGGRVVHGVGIVLGPTLQANLPSLARLPFSLGAQGLEWGETPTWIDPLALAGLLLVAINFMAPIISTPGPLVRHAVVFHGRFRVDVFDLCDGQFPAAVLAGRHQRRRRGRVIHSRSRRAIRYSDGLGPDVLLRADHAAESRCGPRAVAGRLLGAGVLLSAQRHPSLPLHADSDVPATRGHHLDYCRRDGRDHGDHQLLRHDLGIGPAIGHEPADPLVLYRHGVLRHHLPAVRDADDAHLPGADPFQRLGRRACSSGDVRRVFAVDAGHHDLLVSAAVAAPSGTAASFANGTTGCRPSGCS